MDKHHHQILKDIENIPPEELIKEKKDSSTWKIFVAIGGLTIIILLLSLTVVTFPIGDILSGKLESSPLQANILNLDTLTIHFSDPVLQQLQAMYKQNQKTEWSACLQGTIANKPKPYYAITSLYQPTMYEQTFSHISFEPCSSETLIILHTHPYKSCIASQTDLNTLEKTKQRNEDVLMIIMCESERFSVYN